MYRTIVVGHDGTPRSDDALALALALRDPDGCLVLATITSPLHRHAMEALERASSGVPRGVSVERQVMEALNVGAALDAIAAARGADLIVLGSTHRTAIGRSFGRATVQRLIHGAPCAIAVAAPGQQERFDRPRILVAYDASPESEAALDIAYEIAGAQRGTVRLCRVVQAGPVTVEMAAAANRAPDNVAVETRILYGSPLAAIVGMTRTEPFDLAVNGDPPSCTADAGARGKRVRRPAGRRDPSRPGDPRRPTRAGHGDRGRSRLRRAPRHVRDAAPPLIRGDASYVLDGRPAGSWRCSLSRTCRGAGRARMRLRRVADAPARRRSYGRRKALRKRSPGCLLSIATSRPPPPGGAPVTGAGPSSDGWSS